ncbi:MAG: biotin--[acetyl-CoA-carboxylase] ligase [Treponema sp.]
METQESSAIKNPFNAPIYHLKRTGSTMTAAREFIADGCPDGTFIYADFQTDGRGRMSGKQWLSPAGENLLGTLILRRPASTDFTLRIGLAVSTALDPLLPPAIKTAVKWPNDILVNGKKISGILCESAGGCVLAGIGVNLQQTDFLQSIEHTATSVALISGSTKCPSVAGFIPLLLHAIQDCLDCADWHEKVSSRLWMRGYPVRFMRGHQETDIIQGTLTRIAEDGAICIADTVKERRYYSGELIFD